MAEQPVLSEQFAWQLSTSTCSIVGTLNVAPIEFEHVDAPLSKSLSIRLQMSIAPGSSSTGVSSNVLIQTKLQTTSVYLKRKHIALRFDTKKQRYTCAFYVGHVGQQLNTSTYVVCQRLHPMGKPFRISSQPACNAWTRNNRITMVEVRRDAKVYLASKFLESFLHVWVRILTLGVPGVGRPAIVDGNVRVPSVPETSSHHRIGDCAQQPLSAMTGDWHEVCSETSPFF